MNLTQVMIEAFRSMNANRLRTVLTMLGIIIGITSVVLMLALGDSMKRFISAELETLGTNRLYIVPGNDWKAEERVRAGVAAGLTLQDANDLSKLKSLAAAAPVLSRGAKISVGNESTNNNVTGTEPAFISIRNWKVERGSMFSESDVRSAARMAVIGQEVADQFFYKTDPLGKTIRIENVTFEVVGVLANTGNESQDDNVGKMVIVPITTARLHLIRSPFPDNVNYVIAQGQSGANLDDAIEDIKELLRDRHKIGVDAPDDFRVHNMASFADKARQIVAGVGTVLGLIGAISLVVGGIGIMNIMLVSVTERTREIGIRMAIGAKPRDVLLQFLTEAVVICLVGGMVGIGAAMGFAAIISHFAGDFEVYVSLAGVVSACTFASLVGIFFGFYPARRASRLLPVDCLRYE
jgi:putative ABC transport system permease protein